MKESWHCRNPVQLYYFGVKDGFLYCLLTTKQESSLTQLAYSVTFQRCYSTIILKQLIQSLFSRGCPQADERYRKNIQGSPQSAQTKPPQPPVPPRSELTHANGSTAQDTPAMHRPGEPQVHTRAVGFSLELIHVFSKWVKETAFWVSVDVGSLCYLAAKRWY